MRADRVEPAPERPEFIPESSALSASAAVSASVPAALDSTLKSESARSRGASPPPDAAQAVSRRLPADVSAARAARGVVAHLFERWRLPAAARENAQLVASELVSNAVEHGTGPITVHLARRPGRVRIEVVDGGSADKPTVRTPTTTEVRHRGLFLVEAVSLEWGHDRIATGHSVWADIPVQDTAAHDTDGADSDLPPNDADHLPDGSQSAR